MTPSLRPLLCGLPLLFASATLAEEAKLTTKWEITEGLKAPESAYYDADSDQLFLSQIGEGGGGGRDGDGWISKLSKDGKMIENKWVTGFDSPKGLRSYKGTLWVTDLDEVISIDIKSGKVKSRIEVPDATFLNDLAICPLGTVFVSDMVKSRIIMIHNGKPSVFMEGEEIEHPNGLLVQNGKLIVGGWGRGFQEDFSTKIQGRLLSIDIKTKAITPITPEPTGYLDGVESDGGSGFIVTDWRAGKLFHIAGDGKTTLLASYPRGSADHAYFPEKKLLILPEMLENKLSAIELKSAALPK